jgi:transcriptional regulator with XRE-family HTH domain
LRTTEREPEVKIHRHALREIRERSGLSVPALAREVGCSHGALYDIENGNRGASPEMTVRLAKALKCPLVALLADPESGAAA